MTFFEKRMRVVSLVLVLGALCCTCVLMGADDPKLPPEVERRAREADEMRYAFRGPGDIYLVAKGADQPAFVGAKLSGVMRVAGELYYYVELADGATIRLPPSQILMVKFKA